MELVKSKVKCVICTYSDNYENMVEITDEDGKKQYAHKECLIEMDHDCKGEKCNVCLMIHGESHE